MIEKKDNLSTNAVKIAAITKISATYLCLLSKKIMTQPVLAIDVYAYQ